MVPLKFIAWMLCLILPLTGLALAQDGRARRGTPSQGIQTSSQDSVPAPEGDPDNTYATKANAEIKSLFESSGTDLYLIRRRTFCKIESIEKEQLKYYFDCKGASENHDNIFEIWGTYDPLQKTLTITYLLAEKEVAISRNPGSITKKYNEQDIVYLLDLAPKYARWVSRYGWIARSISATSFDERGRSTDLGSGYLGAKVHLIVGREKALRLWQEYLAEEFCVRNCLGVGY